MQGEGVLSSPREKAIIVADHFNNSGHCRRCVGRMTKIRERFSCTIMYLILFQPTSLHYHHQLLMEFLPRSLVFMFLEMSVFVVVKNVETRARGERGIEEGLQREVNGRL